MRMILRFLIKLIMLPIAVGVFTYYLFRPNRAQARVTKVEDNVVDTIDTVDTIKPIVHTHESVTRAGVIQRTALKVSKSYKTLH
jgi:preprotein translocase subunit YajC